MNAALHSREKTRRRIKKRGSYKFSSPKAIEAISLSENLSARISLPSEVQVHKEKFVSQTSAKALAARDLEPFER
jgi:hypothetical protein